MNKNILKSITRLFAVSVVSLLATSCYENFVEDFDYTSVYLPKANIDRTFIMGEGMQIGVGVVLGGTLSNMQDVEVTFSLDESLLDPGAGLPESYYELVDSDGNAANNKIIIPAGKVQGFVYVKADSLNFLSDAISLGHNYALGFKLDNVVNADSLLVDFNTTVIKFSYINQLFGSYIQNGELIKTDLTTNAIETIAYPGDITDNLELTMLSPTTMQCNGIADLRGTDKKMDLTIAEDNTITIQTSTGGVTIVDDSGSFYNPETREITLNYSFEFNGTSYVARDIFEFRNRVVDGVNQVGI